MTTPPDVEQVARLASDQVHDALINMLMMGQLGEVIVYVGCNQLEPEVRLRNKLTPIRLKQGHWGSIKTTR